ncbi:MAG: hypothetical protein ACKOXB_01270 [Flavobacteriales bacterium]
MKNSRFLFILLVIISAFSCQNTKRHTHLNIIKNKNSTVFQKKERPINTAALGDSMVLTKALEVELINTPQHCNATERISQPEKESSSYKSHAKQKTTTAKGKSPIEIAPEAEKRHMILALIFIGIAFICYLLTAFAITAPALLI